MSEYRGHIENGGVVFDQPVPLPDGTPVQVEALAAPPAGFWQAPSLVELAAHQGVATPTAFDDLLGGWPADELDDAFEQDFRQTRGLELPRPPSA